MFRLIALTVCLLTHAIAAPIPSLVPFPAEVQHEEGSLLIDVNTFVLAPKSLEFEASLLAHHLYKLTGFGHRTLAPKLAKRVKRSVLLKIDDALPAGHYTLKIETTGVTISGKSGPEILHGIQSFTQLLPVTAKRQQRTKIPCLTIRDHPKNLRRALQLDTASHLFPLDDLKSLINWMSYHKLNELHLLLNNDHGWRFESLKFPKLTKIGSVRASTPPYLDPTGSDGTEYGGYYTQENLQKLIRYATKRHITVIPTLSLPSQASAILASYPEFGTIENPTVKTTWGTFPDRLTPKPETFQFLETLLQEISGIFPAPEIKIIGDDPQNAFLPKIKKFLKATDRTLTDPAVFTTVDLSSYQHPKATELAEDKNREASEPMMTARQVYLSKANLATLATALVHDQDKLHYQLFPRLAAFAGASWSEATETQYETFRTRMKPSLARYRQAEITPAEIYVPPTRKTLHNTKITTTLQGRGVHWAENIFDGKKETFFWSDRAIKKGDHITLAFTTPAQGDVTIATGGDAAEEAAHLANGVLEYSKDGKEWETDTEFLDGLATKTLPPGTMFLRIRATENQEHGLILHEVELQEALLPEVLDQTLTVRLAEPYESRNLRFQVDFSKHPELRNHIRTLRKHFYISWAKASLLLAVSDRKETPTSLKIVFGAKNSFKNGVLTLNPAKLEKLSLLDTHDLLISHLFPYLQAYPASAPKWFETGLAAYFRMKEIPESTWAKKATKEIDRSKALEGGANSAAFLKWFAEKHTETPLQEFSLSCRVGKTNELYWKGIGHLTLEEHAREYAAE